ncbi:MAG: 7-cyano-7-deazaguanine synthase, partial [Acidobacteriota bacterium]|nr:7-cyano-7-deazaguanine synthase [Acidobacteriota bacterium]
MDPIKNEAAVMFSGGIDSLLAAVLLLQTYDKVHLVTFDKGYLEFGVKNNIPNVERLKARFGTERIHHEIVDLKNVVKRIGAAKASGHRKKYNLETRWCVRCRLGMNTGGLIYALEHNLVGYADGSNREQIPSNGNLTGTAENYPSIVNRSKEFAADYAVRFMTPTYEFGGRVARRQKLIELGFEIDFLSRDHSKKPSGMMHRGVTKRSQPICVSGWIIHWKRNLLGRPVEQNEEMTV